MPPPGRAGLEPAVHGLNTRHTHQPSPRGPAGSPQLPPHGAAPLTAAQENLPGSLLLVCCSQLGGKALQEVLEDALSRGEWETSGITGGAEAAPSRAGGCSTDDRSAWEQSPHFGLVWALSGLLFPFSFPRERFTLIVIPLLAGDKAFDELH